MNICKCIIAHVVAILIYAFPCNSEEIMLVENIFKNPEKYHNQEIILMGELEKSQWMYALLPISNKVAEANSHYRIWIEFAGESSYKEDIEVYDWICVISGVFNLKNKGYLQEYTGTLEQAAVIQCADPL